MAKYNLIGRQKEIEELERLYSSNKSEFLAIYGRRRVGKSYLIDEVYGENMAFSAVGVYFKKEDRSDLRCRQEQLAHFYESLLQYGMSVETPMPNSWREAFRLLRQLLENCGKRRKVVFLDELPWLAGPQSSELIAELGFFWNSWACKQRNIILVVCGSATSWMLDNVIREYGGLYSRLTMKMQLHPFTLGECEQYYKDRDFHFSRYEIALAYMALGGIPYYNRLIDAEKTVKEIEEKVMALLELVDIKEKAFAYPSQLSGGQKQRVAIARALANEPNILLCDEATSALDPQTTSSILKLLKKLNETLGLTIVVITHEMNVVKELCHKVAVMNKGVLIEEGNIFDVFSAPKNQITKDFIDTTSNVSKIYSLVEEKDELTKIKPNECIVRLRYKKGNVVEPMVSHISRVYNVDINIIFANVEVVDESHLGGLVVIMHELEKDGIKKSILFLQEKNIDVEVILDARNID